MASKINRKELTRSQRLIHTLTSTKTLPMMSAEPECEIHPTEESCDIASIQAIHRQRNPSPEEVDFGEQSTDLLSCDEHESNIASEHENDEKSTSHGILFDSCTYSIDESKPESLKSPSDEVSEGLYNPDQPLLAPKDHGYTEWDDSSSIREFEEAMFSMPVSDITAGVEDDLSFCFGLEGTETEIQVAVNEIRKEAEKIDTILVLDQFKTLQTEFDSVSKKCSLKTEENEDLKMQLHELRNKVAHMELERDLHLADAAKLREDLKTVVSKMFDISMYESSELDEGIKSIKENIDSCQSEKSLALLRHPSNTFRNKNHSVAMIAKNHVLGEVGTNRESSRRENIRILGIVDQPKHAIFRSPPSSDPGKTRMTSRDDWSHFSKVESPRLLRGPSENQPLRDQNVFRKRGSVERLPHTYAARSQRQSAAVLPSCRPVRDFKRTTLHRHKTLSAVDTHSTSLVTDACDAEKETQKRRCKMLFRCRSKQRSSSKLDVSVLMQQINQLKVSMGTSLAASEKLRKRLRFTTRYYEGIISKLQNKIADLNREKSRVQDDLANTISQVDVERRLERSKFEYELRRKDEEIARLKAGVDRGEV